MTLEEKQSEYIYRKTYWLLRDIIQKVDNKYLDGSKNDYLNMQIKDHLRLLEAEINRSWSERMENPEFEELPDYGDKMLVSEWVECVKQGGFIDYDGYGNLATEDKCGSIIHPSDITVLKLEIPKWATHVIWYNR